MKPILIHFPEDVLDLMRRVREELPGEPWHYPLDSGMTIEEFRQSLIARLEKTRKPEVESPHNRT